MDQFFEIIGLVAVLPPLAGAVVSGMHLGRTRWAGLLFAGFAAETVLSAFFRLASLLIRKGVLSSSGIAPAFGAASLLGFVAMAAVVAGVAGILGELRAAARPPVTEDGVA